MQNIIYLLFLVFIAYANYFCLNNYDFKHAIIFNFIAWFIEAIIEAIFFGTGAFWGIIIQPIISGFITTYLCDFVFQKSKNIVAYFFILIIIILLVTFVPPFILKESAKMVS